MIDTPQSRTETLERPRATTATGQPLDQVESRPVERAGRQRRWTSVGRYARWGIAATAVVVAVTVVALVTIDLGPSLRARAEQALSGYLDREVTIGRVGVRLLSGRFFVEDLVIGGLDPGDRPFLTAERITLSTVWAALLRGEFLADSVSMTNWQMLAESFPDGRQTFPAFVRQSEETSGVVSAQPGQTPDAAATDDEAGRRFVATLQYLNASDGEFRLEDHGAGWSVVAPNLDFTITKIHDYRGRASFSGGTIQISDFEPMWVDMVADFNIDGAKVQLTRIDLATDGASTVLQGHVDLANFPEMSYDLESDINLTRMREIFFAADDFTAAGDARFSGTFHKFEGGHDLRGLFTSEVGGINQFEFPGLEGALLWRSDRFEVWDVVAGLYGGQAWFDFSMAPLGAKYPGQAVFDVRYEDIDVTQLGRVLELDGIRPVARASGRTRVEWPVGRFDEFRNIGSIELEPPDGVRLATAEVPTDITTTVAERARRPPDLTTREFLLGGGVDYSMADGWIELTAGRVATPATHITFDGRTRWGSDTRIPFQVASANWQESDRLMAAVMTAVGAPTNAFAVDGYGTLDGVMIGDFATPRIEARFAGDDVRAWNVEWGIGRGEFVVENSYLDVAGGHFRRDAAELQVDGVFSLGGSRDDGGEEMNAVIKMTAFPVTRIRQAFGLQEGYTIDGLATGELHLYGAYRRLFGFGRLTLDRPVAYGEPFDSASAGLRFEGTGVRLDGFEMRKGEGVVTGAAFIEWDASYSFNWDARNLPLNAIDVLPTPPEPLSGTIEFNAAGVGRFDDPRYEVRGTIRDLFIGDEEVGQITGRIAVRDGGVTLDLEGASSTFAASASGRIALTEHNEADLSLRVANASLDPYVRMFVPEWSPYTKAVVSGSVDVFGELRNWDRLGAAVSIERVDLSLLDYDIRNNGPIRLSLDRRVVDIKQLRLAGDGTALELSGAVDLARDEVSLEVDGDVNLGILEGFLEDLRGSGEAVVAASVTGSVRQPLLTGQAVVSNGRIRHFSLPHGFEAINGRIIFEPGGIRFEDVAAFMGSGPVTIGGQVGLTGFQLGELGITVTGQEMQLRYPDGMRSIIDTDLVLRGAPTAPVLAGTVTVRDAVLLAEFEMGGGLFGGGSERAGVGGAAPEGSGPPLSFDIRIVAPSSLRMATNTARVVSSAELTWRGSYDRPVLFGTIELERGEAFVEGNRYRLNHGTIGFANLTEIEPFVDVELETDVRVPGQTYRVTVQATGTLERLVPTLSSDPPLPEVDILSLLLGDIRDPQSADLRAARAPELAQQQRFQAGAARLLTSPLSSGVGRVVEDSFGVDTFQITPYLGDPSSQQSAQLTPTARVLIGKRISERAHVTLSRALSGANRDLIVVLEYDQSDRLSWILSQNEDRTYALDVRVRHAF